MIRFAVRALVHSVVLAAAAYGLSAAAQVSIGAQAAATGPGASTSANGGTGGVGLGGVGPGVTVNPGVNAGAGAMASGTPVGNGALVGPRARRNAERELPMADPADRPANAGQRALQLDEATRAQLLVPRAAP
ncbi:hypothetical protein [uncultured Xylophilus sp.]|uniref:hypothetical protein n=1 Tax=uncultured Xylophilus sp. TaxID=296832 RepID=UPI0025E03FE2|nr:hypothetical protein [uncultured Xylophilus sp.]